VRWSEVVRLVATRDLRERLRTKAYRISSVLTAVLVVAVVVVPKLVGDDGPVVREVAAVGRLDAPAQEAVRAAASAEGAAVRFVEVPDEAAAVEAVRDGAVDLAIVDGSVVVRQADDAGFEQLVASALGQQAALEEAGVPPDEVEAVLSRTAPVESLEPPADAQDEGRTAVAFVASLLLYTFLSLYGAWVLYGVAEEKSSRVAEVLLSTVPPSALLAGKILGIGLAALLQGVVILGSALVAAQVTGADLLDLVTPADLLGLLGWFLLGYALYAVVYAAAGSLVARQEDVQNVATPPALPLLVGYIVAAQAAFGDAESPLVRVMSLFPATAPVVMPVRTTVSDVPAWEVALSIALTLAGIVVLVAVASRVYARALLRTGGRVRWREVLRAPA
jgi:ABC-2 type transport system permease protein